MLNVSEKDAVAKDAFAKDSAAKGTAVKGGASKRAVAKGRGLFGKELHRTIKGSFGRFVSILLIAALGAGFYAGLRMTCPDMKLAEDMYSDGTDTFDLRVISTFGLSDANVDELRSVDGVSGVMPAKELDAISFIGDDQYTIRIHSLDVAAAESSDVSDGVNAVSDDPNYINRPILVDGSWPSGSGECVLSADAVLDSDVRIGDTVRLSEGTQELGSALKTDTFVVTGFVRTAYYTSSIDYGSTSLGSGSIDTYMYIGMDDFDESAPWTEAFVTVSGADAFEAGSDAYKQRVAEVADRIEERSGIIASARYDEVKAEAQSQLDEQRSDYEAAKRDAEAELSSASAQLDESSRSIDVSAQELSAASGKLDSALSLIQENARILSSGESEYAAGVEELEAQRAEADEKVCAAQAQIDESRVQLEDALALKAALAEQEESIEEEIAAIDRRVPDIDKSLFEAREKLDAAQVALDDYEASGDIDEAVRAQLIEARDEARDIVSRLSSLKDARSALVSQRAVVLDGIAKIDKETAGVAEALDAAQSQLDSMRAESEERFVVAQSTLDSSRSALDEGWGDLGAARELYRSGLSVYLNGVDSLERGRAAFLQGSEEFEQKQTEVLDGFAEAEKQLEEAQAQIDAIETPDVHVLDRSKNVGMESFASDAERVDRIAQVFPMIFFLVAALVSLTTTTRMVEEERTLIGTYKALGYSRGRIAMKYVLYALIASGIGSVIGIVLMSKVLPSAIMWAYSICYAVPVRPVPVHMDIALLSAGLCVGVALLVTWCAVAATLREKPAALMLPRAPKAGKRILLERIKPLWSHLSFSWKVTARNLFRYKSRFIMTVIGVAGCTGLLLTGLGLHDAINDIIDKQFGEVYEYDTVVRMSDDATDAEYAQAEGVLGDDALLSGYTALQSSNMIIATIDDSIEKYINVLVPEDPATFESGYIDIHNRITKKPIDLAGSGDTIILSEKAATELGADVGDTICMFEQDDIGNAAGEPKPVVVGGIMESYVGYCAIMTPGAYESAFGETPVFTTMYAKSYHDAGQREQIAESLRSVDGVKTVGFNDETIETYRTMLGSIDAIVVVLVVCAMALDFVVLYNLMNINIMERKREIATLKVLGFTKNEVNAYIFREAILLTLIGALVGLVLGVFMEGFVVVTAEVDQVMFGRDIHALSFLIAFLLTMAFSVFVAFAMRRKLSCIDMVESLKSVD